MSDKTEYTLGDIKKLFAIISDLDDVIAENFDKLSGPHKVETMLIRGRIKDAAVLVEDPITVGQAKEFDRLAAELGIDVEKLKSVAIIRDAIRRAVA
jgi:hypothetical protein